ncbi:hypothetical protein EIP91_011435 [Steccherinum ochraceum]|uniref:Stress-activated map kinase-interacting protein 1 n=1 Tax=Steccherinum ochraceum TaxID=92696 RepID=A0A4V2MWZ7_9APHY|nr:hypothetical protein EIP91_011435 [Steccherinum ochraceum]
MSLISDPDFLIHNIRLNYLRHIDDPYGPRLISLDPHYQSNPYVIDAGLADNERWPELNMPSSLPPSDDEGEGRGGRGGGRPTGFPGATGLKYTTTIMGPSRAGSMGLRVSGKRGHQTSGSRSSIRSALKEAKHLDTESRPGDGITVETIPPTPSSPHKPEAAQSFSASTVDGPADSHAAPSASQDDNKSAPAGSRNIPVPFIPKFKGAAEMEARRKLRMQNRVPPGGAVPPRPTRSAPANLNPDISSSSESESEEEKEDDALAEDDDDFEDDAPEVDDSLDILDPDEFDPEFAAASRDTGLGIDSQSDGVSLLSGSASGLSASNFSTSSLPRSVARSQRRLSPVHENRHSDELQKSSESHSDAGDDDDDGPSNSFFSMVTPAPLKVQDGRAPSTSSASSNKPTPHRMTTEGFDESEAGMFTRLPVAPAGSAKSALSSMLATTSPGSASNPFTELYSAISGRAESESMVVQVYFPHAKEPSGQAMDLTVRKDASMEEVLGFALWTYWEDGWLPKLDEGLEGEEDPKWVTKCTALGWILRIAEEDGEVDEDFPPPDRSGKIAKFNFDAYAVLEASSSQITQNKVLDSKIQRRPSRIVIKKKKSTGLLNAMTTTQAAESLLGLGSSSAGINSLLGTSLGMFPSSLGPSSQGPPMFLRIRIADTADAGHVSTTIQTSGGMYMAEVLDAVCQKRKLPNPKDYALVVDIGGVKILIPLDRTVKSLQGKRDLMLIKKNMLQQYGVEVNKREAKTTDPNASIFKRNSELPGPEQIYSSVFDYTSAYKRYTIYRKVPMLVTRSARLLAIDGGYIHIMPQANKAKNVFDNGKTASYDIKSIVACQQSSKNSATFKLVVHRGDTERNKRYEFEAESPKLAG